jgi:uncharacterized protein (TIGR02265 family)
MTLTAHHEPMVARSVLEGLFVHALQPEGAFAEELNAAGFDAATQAPRYPQTVLVRGLDVAWQHRFPTLSRDEAWRELGKLFIEGYFQTTVGRLIGFSVPALRPTRFVSMIPSYVRTGLLDMRTEVKMLGPQRAVVTLTGGHQGCAWLLAGVLEVCFQRMSVPCRFEPAWEEPVARLTLSWGTAV